MYLLIARAQNSRGDFLLFLVSLRLSKINNLKLYFEMFLNLRHTRLTVGGAKIMLTASLMPKNREFNLTESYTLQLCPTIVRTTLNCLNISMMNIPLIM